MESYSLLAKECECCASKTLGTIIPGLAHFMLRAKRGPKKRLRACQKLLEIISQDLISAADARTVADSLCLKNRERLKRLGSHDQGHIIQLTSPFM